jgi:benzoate membrane transport protein
MGAVAIVLGLRYRIPISIAWSTPGAALLLSAGEVEGGFPAAVGAFVVAGLLIALTGCWRRLERWIAQIPLPLANAMLAGVLLSVCTAPFEAAVAHPAMTLPALATWAIVGRYDRRWAVPAAFAVTLVAIAIDPLESPGSSVSLLAPEFVTPTLTWAALVGIALPLYIVTMASQNIPGAGVLRSFGYDPPLRPTLVGTGTASAAAALFGGHAINLAAITAALVSGPDAHPDPARRWIASVACGGFYIALGLCAGLATALIAAAPTLVIEAVAGVALLGALAASLRAALAEEGHREPAVVTFAVTASAITVFGISAPFWGLVAGLGMLAIRR